MTSEKFGGKLEPKTTKNDEFLGDLYRQIEIGWNLGRDATIVDRLAGENPKYSLDLYDFLTILIESELEQTNPEEVKVTAEKTREWLEKEGFELVNKIAEEQNGGSSNNTPEDSSNSQSDFQEDSRIINKETNQLDLASTEYRDNLVNMSEFLQRRDSKTYRKSREKIIQDGAKYGITREEVYSSDQRVAARRRTNKKKLKLSDLIKKLSMNEVNREKWLKVAKEDESE